MTRTAGRITGGVAGVVVALLGRSFTPPAAGADDVRPASVPADLPPVDDDVRPVAFPVPPLTLPGSAFPTDVRPPVPGPGAAGWKEFVATLPPIAPVAPPPAVRGPARTAGGLPLSLDDVLDAADRSCPVDPTDGRLPAQRSAARAYWNWVAAGRQVVSARLFVRPARDRDDRLRERPPAGPDPRTAFADNLRALTHRTVVLGKAEGVFQRAQIALSLYLRDPRTGDPLLAGPDRLPDFPLLLQPDLDSLDAAFDTAFRQRPEFGPVRGERDSVMAFRSAVAKACLPWKKRKAAAEVHAADARLSALAGVERRTTDTVRAEVQDAFARLERAYAIRATAGRRVELARRAATDERTRFDRSGGALDRLLGLEQDVYDAETAETATLADYFQALTDYRAALGVTEPTQLEAPPPATLTPITPAVDKFVPAQPSPVRPAQFPANPALFPAGPPPALAPVALRPPVVDKFVQPPGSKAPTAPLIPVLVPTAPRSLPPVAGAQDKFSR